MTRCVMNARAHGVVENLLHSFVPMSLACSITVSFVGQISTLVQDVSSISHWWRKVLIAHVRSTFAGTKESTLASVWQGREGCMWLTVSEDTVLTCRSKCILLLFTPAIDTCILSAAKTLQASCFSPKPYISGLLIFVIFSC